MSALPTPTRRKAPKSKVRWRKIDYQDFNPIEDVQGFLCLHYRNALRFVRKELMPLGAVFKVGRRYYIKHQMMQDYLRAKAQELSAEQAQRQESRGPSTKRHG